MRKFLLASAVLLLACSAADASVVTYATRTAFTGATTSLVTEGFDGITTPTSGGIGTVAYGTTFSRNGLTIVDGGIAGAALNVLDNTYLNGGNQIRNRFGLAAGSVLDTAYGNLTLTFAAPVNAFGIDLASIARGIAGSSSATFSFLVDGVSIGSYAYSGSSGFGFYGFTSTTSFTSVSILNSAHAFDGVFDSISTQVAPAAVPEPQSIALLGLGLVGLVAFRRRRRA